MNNVPGVVINQISPQSKCYVGSPSIAILPNGSYVASHDIFGPNSTSNTTLIFNSVDKGESWVHISTLVYQWWSTLFVLNEHLYIIGVTKQLGSIAIRKSEDNGSTWTDPTNGENGLLSDEGEFHCAPVPVTIYNGRIWRAFEHRNPPEDWGVNYRSVVVSAPLDSNLLHAKSWTRTNFLRYDPEWKTISGGNAWLEGNIVPSQNGLVCVLRVNIREGGDVAAVVKVENENVIGFDPKDFIRFPGGNTKFTIRFDSISKRYWTLSNKQQEPVAKRNNLVLASSEDLYKWEVRRVVLYNNDLENVGFQYVDWLVEGDDIIAISRTAFNGANNFHDANYLTFHRVPNFRQIIA
jgi:hypothetical protein